MFSPGLFDGAWVDVYVLARLASHGFVVAATTHYGESALWWDPPFVHLATAAVERPRDVSFALASRDSRTSGWTCCTAAHRPSFSGYCETTRFLGQLGFLGPETVEQWLSPWGCDAPDLIAPAVAHGLVTKYAVAFLKVNLAGDLRYAPLLVPALANSREPDLGFVASELPKLGIPPDERECTFGYFPHARSRERLQADKEFWVPCP